ncbi:MAG: hypothetical protein NVS2B9_14270 [Myxococcales bacterium]
MIQPQIDALLAWATPMRDDIVVAKNEYFAATGGEVHEEDRCFEQRMQGFFNFYLFDRKGGDDGTTPVQRYLRERGASLGGHDKDILLGCTNSRLSLYEYRGRGTLLRRVPKGKVRVRDMIAGEDFNVQERRQMHGLEEGDLFEARLVPVAGVFHFSSSFTYHPREVRSTILSEIKRRKKAEGTPDARALCWELEKMSLQAERFRNVAIDAIYNFENPFLGQRARRTPGEAAHG